MIKPKVLIVDDVFANRLSVKTILKPLDVDLIEAASGEEGMRLAVNHSDLALILLDVQMPEIDGFTVAQMLRDEKTTKNIPIVFLTAINNDEEHKLEGYKSGAIDYISKPITPFILLAKTQLFVELWLTKSALEKQLRHSQQVEEEMRFMATHDALTGLPNRSQFISKLESAIVRIDRYGNNAALFFLDLDGFKQVNDTYGHEAGDIVLKAVSERLKKLIRATDTAARFSGDEFVLLLTDLDDYDFCETKSRTIIETINQPIEWKGETLSVGVSLGVSMISKLENSGLDVTQRGKQALKDADLAMYNAKKNGKNDFSFSFSAEG